MISTTRVISRDRTVSLKWAWILFLTLASAALLACHLSAAPPTSQPQDDTTAKSEKELVATFAGGCFWCTEAVFERMEGVTDVISGYIGGHVRNPTYEQVCTKLTGHAEAVEIYYDPSKTTYDELLEVFFKTHDPTTLNRQGPDSGPQYRSSVFYHDEQQQKAAQKYIAKLNASDEYDGKVVTKLEKATTFYPAEEYHQDFFEKNPRHRYCQAIVRLKVNKFNRTFSDKLKKDE